MLKLSLVPLSLFTFIFTVAEQLLRIPLLLLKNRIKISVVVIDSANINISNFVSQGMIPSQVSQCVSKICRLKKLVFYSTLEPSIPRLEHDVIVRSRLD